MHYLSMYDWNNKDWKQKGKQVNWEGHLKINR